MSHGLAWLGCAAHRSFRKSDIRPQLWQRRVTLEEKQRSRRDTLGVGEQSSASWREACTLHDCNLRTSQKRFEKGRQHGNWSGTTTRAGEPACACKHATLCVWHSHAKTSELQRSRMSEPAA